MESKPRLLLAPAARHERLGEDRAHVVRRTGPLCGPLCGWALAQGHARSGERVQIWAYLGKSERFDRAIGDFAEAHANQTERDHAALCAAVGSGRLAEDDVGA